MAWVPGLILTDILLTKSNDQFYESLLLHTDLDGPKVSKKSLLRQNGLQIKKKCLRLIVKGSSSPFLSAF